MAAGDDNLPVVVDPWIWRALAGDSVQIPTLNSKVYYFPQGHIEHCGGVVSSPLISPSSYNNTSPVPCLVSSIELLADSITDEVFAHLSLQPMMMGARDHHHLRYEGGDVEEKNIQVVKSYAKILTSSDANNGGGFTVPRPCADTVFPPLDFQADPPLQELSFTDIHGAVWKFRHIYRGSPRRHLLTTGWSKFVNNKKLIAGDSVVFMRKSVDEMFIGVKRAPMISSSNGGDENTSSSGDAKKEFRRTGKGKLTAEAVAEAINRAAQGLPFEVDYYPTAGRSDFVVKAQVFDASMAAIYWKPGTRVNMMAMETTTWFQGTVSSTNQETGPWKVLHPTKRLKHSYTEGFFNEEGESHNYERGQSSVAAPDPRRYGFSYSTSNPAGMQGARHYGFGCFNPTGFIKTNITPILAKENSIKLFGEIINVQEEHSERRGLAESSLYEEDVSKESSDNNEDLIREAKQLSLGSYGP